MTLSIQIIGLFFGIWFTFVNIAKVFRGHPVSWQNGVIMSSAWTAFICVTWIIK